MTSSNNIPKVKQQDNNEGKKNLWKWSYSTHFKNKKYCLYLVNQIIRTYFSDKIVTVENVVINQRVRRGIDWNFSNQDCQNGLGTVVGPIKDGWVGIRWDNGNWHMYPISTYCHSMLGRVTEHSLYIA